MPSPIGERAIAQAVRYGNAILKFISPNDVDLTGAHQFGYYLPKAAWQIYTEHPPTRGRNDETAVHIVWQDGRTTDSRVKWYGKDTRSEYRLTRFGKDFPYRTGDCVGNLLLLVPQDFRHFLAFVLDLEEDIEELQASLGVDITSSWAAIRNHVPVVPEPSEGECIEQRFRRFVQTLDDFPAGAAFSAETVAALRACIADFEALAADETLLRCMETEYRLFRLAERRICEPEIVRIFRDVDDFLGTASRIMNRRKARAGRSLENHVEFLLKKSGLPHVMRPKIDGRPDILIPSVRAYDDPKYPRERLVVVGIKTTCKDRWRQVLQEGKRVRNKHIITIQKGISHEQLILMRDSGVTLVVPARIRDEYYKRTPMAILSLEQFIDAAKQKLN
jgi:hypothetical protein